MKMLLWTLKMSLCKLGLLWINYQIFTDIKTGERGFSYCTLCFLKRNSTFQSLLIITLTYLNNPFSLAYRNAKNPERPKFSPFHCISSAWVKPLGFVNSRDFIDFSSLDAKGELKINVIYSIVAKNVKDVMHFLGL